MNNCDCDGMRKCVKQLKGSIKKYCNGKARWKKEHLINFWVLLWNFIFYL
jgi:hypothetical protein